MSLVAQYLFDDAPGSSVVVDAIAARNGSRVGDSTLDGCSLSVTGHAGSTFASSSDVALTPNRAHGSMMAWMGWPASESALFRDSVNGAGWMIVGRRDGDSVLNQLEYRVGGTAVHTGISLTFLENRLRHYAITWDATSSKLYIDGVLIYTGPACGPTDATLPFRYGKNGFFVDYLPGRIADWRLYDNRLTDGDVAAIAAVGSPCDPPLVDFVGTPRSGPVSLDVDFTSETVGADSLLWDFGDGDTSTAADPTHTYLLAGVYTVSLTGTNSNGDTTETKVAYIVAGSPDPVGWDAYAADAPTGGLVATLQGIDDPIAGATARAVRVELNGPGSGAFNINRYSPVAAAAIIAQGNVVKCRFPWRDGYDFAFLLEKGDFTLAAADEHGGEEFSFGGRGILAYLERAVMDAVAYTTGLDVTDKLVELWHTKAVPKPVGVAYLAGEPDYVRVISATTRRVYKVRQSDRKVVSVSPALWAGSTNYAAGLSADPGDANVLWALEAPWSLGGAGNTKIRKIQISTWTVLSTTDLGSAVQLTDLRAGGTNLYTSRYDTGKIQRRTMAVPGTVAADWTVTYKGHAQTHPNGIAISDSGSGTEIAMWFGGTASGGVKLALVADLTDPSTITRTIDTHDIAAFGGDWITVGGSDYLLMVSYVLGLLWKYQLTAATPHDPVDGKWRLDEGTPGAILWRIIQEAQSVDRPQQPLPDLTYGFTDTDDSAAAAWDTHDGTLEFDAAIGDSVLATALRLIPYGLVLQMTPDVVLVGQNASSYGTDRTGAAFGAGVVRFVKGVNIVPELGRQDRERLLHSHMLATGKDNIYARATLADLGYVREGFIGTDLVDPDALEGTAEATLDDERVRRDRIRFKVVRARSVDLVDEDAGLYLPFTHYNVGDLVTLDTGADEHDFTNETFVLYAITLEEGEAGDFPTPVIELGSASLTDPATGSTGGGSSSGGSGGAAVLATASVTLEGTDDTGAVVTTAIGRTIRSAFWNVYQRGAGVVEVVLGAIGTLLGLDDVDADGIADGQVLVRDAAAASFVPGYVEDVATAATNAALVLAPDGAGGTAFRAETGQAGRGAISIAYVFSTTTTDSDPGNGILRLSNATQSSAVTARADLLDDQGADVTALLDATSSVISTRKGYLRVQHATDRTKWLVGTISAIATPGGGGYRNITIANIAKSANSPFADGDAIIATIEIPTLAHHGAHEPGGADAMAVDAAAATGSLRTLGTGAAQAAAGNDTRFGTAGAVTHAQKAAANIAALRLFR